MPIKVARNKHLSVSVVIGSFQTASQKTDVKRWMLKDSHYIPYACNTVKVAVTKLKGKFSLTAFQARHSLHP